MTRTSTTSRILRGFGASGFHQIVNIALQLGLVPIFASRWGVSLYGVWLMIFTIPSFLALTDLGFANASTIEMTMRIARGDLHGATKLFQSGWVTTLCVPTSLCLVAVSAVWIIPASSLPSPQLISSFDFRSTLSLMIAYGWLCLQGSTFMGVLRANSDFALSSFLSAMVYLSEGILAALAALSGGKTALVASTYVLGRLLGVCGLAYVSRRRATWLRIGFSEARLADVERLFRPAMASMTIPMSTAGVLQGTALAVGVAAGPSAVAAFTAVRTLTRAGVQMASLLTQPVAPEFSAAYARNERSKLARLYLYNLCASMVVLVPAVLVLCAFGPTIVLFWTHGAIQVEWNVVCVMTAAMLCNGIWTSTSSLLQAMNSHGLYAYTYATLAVLSVSLSYFISGRLGTIGAGLSVLALDALMLLLMLLLAARLIATFQQVRKSIPWLISKIASVGIFTIAPFR